MKEMTESLISIVVPIYNVEKYLNRCVDSILNQTYRDIEIILVDDGSPDRCGSICDEYQKRDTRIKVIHKKNGGLSDARNAGIKMAHGEYITCIDSDDFISPFFLENLWTAMKKSKCEIATSWFVDYYEGDQCEYGRIPEGMHERRVRNRLCIVGQPHPRPFAGGLEFTEG